MSPDELEQLIENRPMPDFRLTLASGDQIVITEADEPFVIGLALILGGDRNDRSINVRSKLVSVPNIVMAEPAGSRPRPIGRRRTR
jgi:hypothetical protein